MSSDCQSCGAPVEWDRARGMSIEAGSGAWRPHQCPLPDVPRTMECICGAVIEVYADGRRIDRLRRQPHDHGSAPAPIQPAESGNRKKAKVLSE